MKEFFTIKKKDVCIPIEKQRDMWFKEFLKVFLAVFISYACMYLIRNNLKAAQPLLKGQLGFTTSELGSIGFAFSITYAIGKSVLGYTIDGKNAKRIISVLLIMSAAIVFFIGIILLSGKKPTGIILILWGLSGFLQSPGGPGSYSTITRWTPTIKRGRYLGFWNMSHNIGGALAGGIALWGANTFFHGKVEGMFIVPSIVVLTVGFIVLFLGKDDPQELGWNSSEEIFGEIKAKDNLEVEDMSKFDIFKNYVLKNPWIWILCISNVFIYIVRIGIDNWAPLYVSEYLHFSMSDSINTIFYFETGALIGSLSWGFVSDLLKGRRALVAIICIILTSVAVLGYRYGTSVTMINTSLFALGALIFGPQLLIGISLVGFVPKKAVSAANGLTGTFGYLFGDSTAKVLLAKIADPNSTGINIFGMHLQGWTDVFVVFYVALIISGILLAIVVYGEEMKIRKQNNEKKLSIELAS